MVTQAELIEATEERIVPNYGRHILGVVKGSGSRLWDADGKEYLDFFPGFGAGGVTGHCHPKIVEAVKAQADSLISHGNFFTSEPQVDLARRITDNAFGGKVFFCHSGAEANETAFKLARLAAGPGRYKIISFDGCFHGRTMGGLSLTPTIQDGFEPIVPGTVTGVPYGDLAAITAVVDDETAGVFVEPIQAEGGVLVPSAEFMQGLRTLCDDRGVLLICDEVWTGPARTGKWFAYQHYGIVPDVMTLAKAVGGGLPVGVCAVGPKWADVLGPGTHGCTMGGNPLCAVAGAAAMKLIADEGLVDRATTLGRQVLATLAAEDIPCVQEIRGKGLLVGMQLDEARPAKDVMLQCMDRGLIVCIAKRNVLRLAPALTIDEDDLARGLEILIEVLNA